MSIHSKITLEVIIVNISQCYRYNVKPSSEMADV